MQITYTKSIELTEKQAIIETNEYLANHNCKYKFEVVKSQDNDLTIYIYVKRTHFDDPNVPIYRTGITVNKDEFEKRLSEYVAESYSDK